MWLDELNNSLTTYIVMEETAKFSYAGYWLVAGEAQITRVAVAAGERERGWAPNLRRR